MRIITTLCTLLFILATPTWADADEVALLRVSGKKAPAIQTNIKQVLQNHNYDVVIIDERGQASAVVATFSADIQKVKKRWQVTIEVSKGATGDFLTTATIRSRKLGQLPKAVKKQLWRNIKSAMASAAQDSNGAATEEEEDLSAEETPDAPSKVARKSAPKSSKQKWDTTILIGPRFYGRSFSYSGDETQSLAQFSAFPVVAIAFEAQIYPKKHFGVTAKLSYTPQFDSVVSGANASFGTTANEFSLGPIARTTLGSIALNAAAELGSHSFAIDGNLPLPNMTYRYARLAAGGAYPLSSKMKLGVNLGYRLVFASGDMEEDDFFPNSTVSGIDARLSFRYSLSASLHAEVVATAAHYSFALNTEAGDALSADRAVDLYGGTMVLLGYTL